MLFVETISYNHPNKEVLFDRIQLSVQTHEKIALIGNNGAGKSTLLKLINGELQPSLGHVRTLAKPYLVPQVFGQFNHLTVAEALGVSTKLKALQAILKGDVAAENFTVLNDNWTIEERCAEAMQHWLLNDISLTQSMNSLSGGQKVKVFLAGIRLFEPQLVLLDEPTNHLDVNTRQLVYDWIQSTTSTMVVVSHDRRLLNLLGSICELSKQGIIRYGGDYDFYQSQKQAENDVLKQDISSAEKVLRKAKTKERETLERQQKLNARGKGKHETEGVARIMMNTLRNNAEKSTAKLKGVHTEKIVSLTKDLTKLRSVLPRMEQMKLGFETSELHRGKVLVEALGIQFFYSTKALWRQPFSFKLHSGERVALRGANGSGKTTWIQLMLGTLQPQQGTLNRANFRSVYIDQEYSLLNPNLSVYGQAQQFNHSGLLESDIKTRLSRFLFTRDYWDKTCSDLSGGERLRLILCCLTISPSAPDLIVLDEPTNNLDLQNMEILTTAINQYKGTLVVVSHDERFLEEVGIERFVEL
jgi:ATPase subunit of ABC transporter with duplicated ATPase domains